MTLLQRSARILPSEVADITEALAGYLEAEGIEIVTGVELQSVAELLRQLSSGGESKNGGRSSRMQVLPRGPGTKLSLWGKVGVVSRPHCW